jgi:hypothetical protein
MKESTKTLYEAVAKAIGMEDGVAPGPREKEFLDDIKAEHYNDFLSGIFPNPISILIVALKIFGLHELAERAMAGDFDGTSAEAREYLLSDEGRSTAKRLGVTPDQVRRAVLRKDRGTSADIEADNPFRESA